MDFSIHCTTFKHNNTYILPLELWFNIFQLSDLEETDLYHLTLVCHLFRSIAQLFLFDELIISLQSPLNDYQIKYLQMASYLCRFEERLEFITSTRTIALGVHFMAIKMFIKIMLSHLPSDSLKDSFNIMDELDDAF